MKKWILMATVLAGTTVQAAWFGQIGRANGRDEHSIEFIYDTGDRDIRVKGTNGPDVQLNAHRFTVQYARGLGQGFELFARGVPFTGRINLENSSFNPDLWGLGGGLHWSPPEPIGPVRLGFVAGVDFFQGTKSSRDNLNWLELSLAGGATVPLVEHVDLFGGVSFVRPDMRFEISNTVTKFDTEQRFGGFGGIGYSPNDAWTLTASVELGAEAVVGMSARYHFQ